MRRKEGSVLFPEMASTENINTICEIVKPYFGIRVINTFAPLRSPSEAKAEACRAGAEAREAPDALALEFGPRGYQALLGNYRLIDNGAQI
jgi:hypothetical protein